MANAFDDLLTNLVDRLKNVGMGSRTAAENRAMIDYVTASNRQAQAGQATPGSMSIVFTPPCPIYGISIPP